MLAGRGPSLIVSVFSSYRRKLEAPSLPGFIRQRVQLRYRSQLHGLPLFTWPGAPRRATRTSSSPSKPLRPLVKDRSPLWGVGGGRSTACKGLICRGFVGAAVAGAGGAGRAVAGATISGGGSGHDVTRSGAPNGTCVRSDASPRGWRRRSGRLARPCRRSAHLRASRTHGGSSATVGSVNGSVSCSRRAYRRLQDPPRTAWRPRAARLRCSWRLPLRLRSVDRREFVPSGSCTGRTWRTC